MFSRIRKAVVGGLAAGISAVASSFVYTGAPTKDDVAKMLGTFIVAAVVGGYAVYQTPKNAEPLAVERPTSA